MSLCLSGDIDLERLFGLVKEKQCVAMGYDDLDVTLLGFLNIALNARSLA